MLVTGDLLSTALSAIAFIPCAMRPRRHRSLVAAKP
jgi:hypothetical protein